MKKRPDEIQLPDDFPDPYEENPATLQFGYLENTNLDKAVEEGRVKIPPCTIGGQAVEIFEMDSDGKTKHFHAPRMADKIAQLLMQGETTIIVEIPGITANVIGNMLNPGRFYFIERVWQDLLAQLLPRAIFERCNIPITCAVSVIDTQPQPTIRGEVQVMSGHIGTA